MLSLYLPVFLSAESARMDRVDVYPATRLDQWLMIVFVTLKWNSTAVLMCLVLFLRALYSVLLCSVLEMGVFFLAHSKRYRGEKRKEED